MINNNMSKNQDFWRQLLFISFGVIGGISVRLNSLVNYDNSKGLSAAVLDIALGAIVFTTFLWLLRRVIRKIVSRSRLPVTVKERYQRYDTFTYGAFLLPVLGAVGVQSTFYLLALIVLCFLSLQFFLIYSLMAKEHRHKMFTSPNYLSFLFLISGLAALIYQIVWQRSLFTAFGVNIESITIIVSIFMLGLGIGSIVGGILSKRFPSVLPQLFLTFEVLIGIFGIISLPLIKTVSNVAVHASIFGVSLTMYALLSIPTMLMGATLPILVTYVHKYLKNVGKSVGILYFMNTVGSAIACFITATILFVLFGQQISVFVAALCNFTVGVLVYKYTKRLPQFFEQTRSNLSSNTSVTFSNGQFNKRRKMIRFSLILLLSAVTGYISLSQEIIWIRTISFVTGGKSDDFAFTLGFFLFGIAYGALIAKKVSEKRKIHPLIFVAMMLSISSVAYYFSIPISSRLLTISGFGLSALFLLVGITSFLMGGIFPMLCHFGIKSESSVGFSVSWVYFANIIGSTAGPLFTGFILLNSLPLEQNILYLSVIILSLAGIVWLVAPISIKPKTALLGSIVCGMAIMFLIHDAVYSQILEKMHYKTTYSKKKPFKYIIQNRVGIIAVESSKTDIVYGGGVYDGQFNIDPVLNTNGIRRAYIIAALHPDPKEVLEVGLSSGSWSRVIANHTDVKKLTVVEINPGYIELIQKYPEFATILHDLKVTISIDDGRRWLNRHPEAKFDVIVWNASFHWRNYATNTLSEEFLRLCKNHLKPGGVIYYNTTGSEDITFTATHVFTFVTQYDSFVAASDSPFVMTADEKRKNLLKFQNSGNPIFAKDNLSLHNVLEELIAFDLSDKADIIRNKTGLWHITDDNMATEFKSINRWSKLYNSEITWANLFRKVLSLHSG